MFDENFLDIYECQIHELGFHDFNTFKMVVANVNFCAFLESQSIDCDW
jgi:hypothetical protein